MAQDEFQPTARELLERHLAAPEPTRPEQHYGERYAQGVGDYVSETQAARQNDAMINREYYAHARAEEQRTEPHREQAAPERGDRVSAREALQRHLEGARDEITQQKVDPFNRDRAREQEYER